MKTLEMFLSLKIFEVEKKGVRDDVLTSNYLSGDILVTRLSPT